jgi:ABC-type uncharacterized transport system ATPase subunit
MNPILQVEKLAVQFDGFRILNDLSFSVNQGKYSGTAMSLVINSIPQSSCT